MSTADAAAEIALDTDTPIESAGEGGPTPELPPPTGMLALIDRYVRDPTISVERLERILALKERMDLKEAEIEFNEAKASLSEKLASYRIVRTKSVLYDIDKNNKAKGQQEAFKYAPLEDIDKIVRPLLVEAGMDVSYTTSAREREGGGAVITARLTHRSGHFQEASIPIPLDTTGGKSNTQAMGSTFSYGRRYTLCMLLNIVTIGEDDDGSGGYIDDAQAKTIRELMISAGADEPRFLKYMHAPSVEEIAFRDYRKAISALDEKIAKGKGQ
jgi:hypothetical protein